MDLLLYKWVYIWNDDNQAFQKYDLKQIFECDARIIYMVNQQIYGVSGAMICYWFVLFYWRHFEGIHKLLTWHSSVCADPVAARRDGIRG